MKLNRLFIALVVMVLALPISAAAKDKKKPAPRGIIESMQALPCGVKQKGLNGLGTLWGSVGVTSVNANEKLCPQYLLRTDDLDYHIRPMDTKHPIVLPVGHEAEFKVKKDRLYLKVPDGDRKTHQYQVVAMEPANHERENAAYHPDARQDKRWDAGFPRWFLRQTV